MHHQIDASRFIIDREWAALFDEQGLGKTKIVIDALAQMFASQKIQGAIVICKKSLLKTWEHEIVKHSHLKSVVLTGSKRQKGLKFMWFAHFYLLNYDLVHSELERLKGFLSTRPMAIVLDESQRIKNPESRAAEAILQLQSLAARRYIITGTPIGNCPQDIWTQVYFLDGGASLGATMGDFLHRYNIQAQPHREPFLDPTGLSHLRDDLAVFSMRRRKNEVLELPEKTFETHEVSLESTQQIMYDRLRQELQLEITNLAGDQIIDNAENILKRMLRLVEIASNPKLIDSGYEAVPAKFVLLDALLKEIIERGEKAIVWTSFVGNIRTLKKRYQEFGSEAIYGAIPIEARDKLVTQFQESSAIRILVANPAAAREGLTLTAANHAIYLDRNFNLIDYLQSQDRIHRISQQKKAHIHNLIARGTIDGYIEDVVYRKQMISEFIYGDKQNLEQLPQTFTREEVLRLLGH
jgi:SNF2 family DNA or RNA helicase